VTSPQISTGTLRKKSCSNQGTPSGVPRERRVRTGF
jgi:hypothetical protein